MRPEKFLKVCAFARNFTAVSAALLAAALFSCGSEPVSTEAEEQTETWESEWWETEYWETEIWETEQSAQTEWSEPEQPAQSEWQETEQPAQSEWQETEQPAQTEWSEPEQPAQTEWFEPESPVQSEWTETEAPPQTEWEETNIWPETEYETQPFDDEFWETEWIEPPISVPETEEAKERFVLADTNGDVEAAVFVQEGSGFPNETTLRLLTIEDIIGDSTEKEQHCRELRQILQDTWKETMQKEDISEKEIRAFLPYYVMVMDGEGNEIEAPQEVELRLIIREKSFYEDMAGRSDLYRIAWHGHGDVCREITDKEILQNDAEKYAQIRLKTQTFGWFSVLQVPKQDEETEQTETNPFAPPGPQVGVMLPEIPETQAAVEEQTETALQTDTGQEVNTEWQTETEWQTDAEWQTETETETDAENMIMPMYLDSSGTSVTTGGNGFVLMEPGNVDTSYRPVKWYKGQSSLELFNNAGSNVQKITETRSSYNDFAGYYPKNNSAKGKFGAIYHKVLFRDGIYYDMKMTVINYTDKTWVGSSSQEHEAFTPILFNRNHIAWWTLQRVGEIVLKIEFFRNGDAGQTPVSQNIRLQWYDIDACQRFGIRTDGGNIRKKYYQTNDSIVHYKKMASKADTAHEYLYLTASKSLASDSIIGNIGFALEDCSTYYISFGYLDQLKTGTDEEFDPLVGRHTKKRLEEILAGLEKGDGSLAHEDGSTGQYDELRQTDLEVVIPLDDDYPKKYVSNSTSSWSESNTLPDVKSEYYYKIVQYVPEQQSKYRYTKFVITDTLPAGVDYAGDLSVICEETQGDVTDLFTVAASDDKITIKPEDPAGSSFMGYYFDIIFKVKLDTGEISPAYKNGAATYTVKNTAKTEAVMQNYSEVFSGTSNEVTTTASVKRNLPEAPKKGINQDAGLTSLELGRREDTILFSVFQAVPENDAAWRPDKIRLTDELEDCLEYVGAKVYCRQKNGFADDSASWKASADGQTVTIERDFSASPPKPENLTYRFDISCRVKKDCDLAAYERTIDIWRWYVIPNTAKVTFTWTQGEALTSEKETNEVTVKIKAGKLYARLLLTKEIDTADIVWAHGNPIFTFKVTGEDVYGGTHTYYETVEFSAENTGNGAKAALTAEMTVPAGHYKAAEETTMRYRLQSIYNVSGGTASGSEASFDVSRGGTGKATFYNIKTTDEGGGHTFFARNIIKKN